MRNFKEAGKTEAPPAAIPGKFRAGPLRAVFGMMVFAEGCVATIRVARVNEILETSLLQGSDDINAGYEPEWHLIH